METLEGRKERERQGERHSIGQTNTRVSWEDVRTSEEQGRKGRMGEEGHVVTTCTSYALLSLSTVTITNMCSSPYVCQVSVALVLWALQITVAEMPTDW